MEPVVGIIISLALVVAAFTGRPTRPTPTIPSGSDEVHVISRGNALSLGVQKPGTELSIETLVLEESVNLGVVRVGDTGNVPLAMIKLPKGSYQKLIVSLDKSIKSDDELVVALVSRKTSQPIVDGRGEVMTRNVTVE